MCACVGKFIQVNLILEFKNLENLSNIRFLSFMTIDICVCSVNACTQTKKYNSCYDSNYVFRFYKHVKEAYLPLVWMDEVRHLLSFLIFSTYKWSKLMKGIYHIFRSALVNFYVARFSFKKGWGEYNIPNVMYSLCIFFLFFLSSRVWKNMMPP